jgi:hypothetical protein
MEMEYGSKGVAGAGLGLGIAGTALGLMAGGLNGTGLFNTGCNRNVNGCGCHEDHVVNRYEAGQAARIAELETEVKLRDANTYTDGKLLDLYKYVDGKFACIEGQIGQQAVYNATNTAVINCLQNQVNVLMGLTKTVIPNTSICPGWGNVTVTPAAAPTTGA